MLLRWTTRRHNVNPMPLVQATATTNATPWKGYAARTLLFTGIRWSAPHKRGKRTIDVEIEHRPGGVDMVINDWTFGQWTLRRVCVYNETHFGNIIPPNARVVSK